MTNKDLIYNLLNTLIASEKLQDAFNKSKDKNLKGESAQLYHLKRLKELIEKEIGK